MRFDALVSMVGGLPWFDLATVLQLTGERRRSVTNQLHRFCKAKKIVSLRRGVFVLAERYRRTPVHPAELAGVVYRPSYLSGSWALSYYGLIPEGVPVFTSVTPRSPRRFENDLGEYVYRHLKQSLFFGSVALRIAGSKVMVASPEKALIDIWHLTPGLWTAERMREMRFATSDLVDTSKLESMLDSIAKPRLLRAYELWTTILGEEGVGEVEL